MSAQATMDPPTTDQETKTAPAPAGPATPSMQAPVKKGYGKRPMWQWVLIYVVVAIIVYGIIYFVWIRNSGSSTGGGY